MKDFVAVNWYWIVAGSTTQAYSSLLGNYVPVADTTYQAWLTTGGVPTKIDTEANLGDTLAVYADTITRPVPAGIVSGFQDRLTDATLKAIKTMVATNALNTENRLRALERAVLSSSAPDLNNTQLKQLIKSML